MIGIIPLPSCARGTSGSTRACPGRGTHAIRFSPTRPRVRFPMTRSLHFPRRWWRLTPSVHAATSDACWAGGHVGIAAALRVQACARHVRHHERRPWIPSPARNGTLACLRQTRGPWARGQRHDNNIMIRPGGAEEPTIMALLVAMAFPLAGVHRQRHLQCVRLVGSPPRFARRHTPLLGARPRI